MSTFTIRCTDAYDARMKAELLTTVLGIPECHCIEFENGCVVRRWINLPNENQIMFEPDSLNKCGE